MVRPRFGSSSTARFANIWVDHSKGVLCVRTPYNEDFIYEFKRAIPREYRRWIKEDKVWHVETKFLDEVINLCSKYFEVDTIPTASADVHEESPYHVLIKYLSMKGIEKVWKIVVSELHPDVGGDHDKFIEAMSAYETIKEEKAREEV